MLLFWKYRSYLQEIHNEFSNCFQGVNLNGPNCEFSMLVNGSECKHINSHTGSHIEFHSLIVFALNQTTKKLSGTSRRTSRHGCVHLSPPPVLAVCVSTRRGLIAQMSLQAPCWVGIIQALVIWAESHQESSPPGWNAIETRLVHSLPAVCVQSAHCF